MPRCRFCDKTNPAGTRKCAGCGAELSVDEEEAPPGADMAGASEATGLEAVPDPLERKILSVFATRGKIAAIKEFREHTGAGLKEAKDAVELLAERYGVKPAHSTGCTVSVGGAILIAIIVARLL